MPRLRPSPAVLFYLPLVLLTLVVPLALPAAGEGLEAPPLLQYRTAGPGGETTLEALGPLVYYESSPHRRRFGLRPLVFWSRDQGARRKSFYFLYPFSVWRSRPREWTFQAFFYLLSFKTTLKPSGYKEREFTLFPFIFARRAERPGGSFFALFPLAGVIRNKFHRDEITFAAFPLYLRTRSGEEVNTHLFWPVLGFFTGGGQSGFRVWPLFGYRKRVGGLKPYEESFILWPIHVRRRMTFYGEEIRTFSLLPLYSTVSARGRRVTTYLWPFFNHAVDTGRGWERWDAPWPLFSVARSSPGFPRNDKFRLFPLYSLAHRREDREGFVLWPLYRFSERHYADYESIDRSVLLFLYSDTLERPLLEGGRSGRRVVFWPLLSYARSADGSRTVHALAPLEPFLGRVEGLAHTVAPLWRIFSWRATPDGASETSILWDVVRLRNLRRGFTFDLQAVLPLLSVRNLPDDKGVSILGGALGLHSRRGRVELDLLYMPLRIKDNGNVGEGGGGYP